MTDDAGRTPVAHGSDGNTQDRYTAAVGALNDVVGSGDFTALPRIIEDLRSVAGELPDSDPRRAGVLNNLGSALQLEHERSGHAEQLSTAETHYRSAVAGAHTEDPDTVLYLCNLALVLDKRAGHTADEDPAEEAVRAANTAVQHAPTRDQRRATALARLASALQRQSRLSGDPSGDAESLVPLQEAVSITSGPERAGLQLELGAARLRQHSYGDSPDRLDAVLTLLQEAIDQLTGRTRARAIRHLAEGLRLRFQQHGDLTDLRTALGDLFELIESVHPGDPMLGGLLADLARAAAEYSDTTGEPGPLRRTLRLMDSSARGLAANDPDRDLAFAGFGALLRRRFLQGAGGAALESAVAAGETAVRLAPDPTTAPGGRALLRRSAVQDSLITTLILRYEHTENTEDLYRADQVCDEILEYPVEDTHAHRAALAQRGTISHHRHRHSGRQSDLDKAVEHYEQALSLTPSGAEERAGIAANLGRALRTAFHHNGRRRTYRTARRVLREAAELPTAPSDQRLRAANLAGRVAAQAGRWQEALESFSTAVELLPLAVQGGRAEPRARRRWAAITADAASCAVESGEPQRAVELLEHGNSALLTHAVSARGETAEMGRSHPDLAGELDRVRRLLDKPSLEPALSAGWSAERLGPVGGDDPGASGEGVRRQLAESWSATVDAARHRTGGAGFLQVPTFAELAPAAEGGPVVLINLSRYRSDAFVIIAGRVLVIPLNEVTPDTAGEYAWQALAAAEGDREPANDQDLRDALDWLWQTITRPVLDTLGYSTVPSDEQRWPRLWWCRSGLLGFLPLHAAESADGQACVLDRVVSSYTPSLRVLARAREHEPADDPESRGLVVTDAAGAAVPSRYWPDATVLRGNSTARSDLLHALPRHPWVHLGEAAAQHPVDPTAGRLLDRGDHDDAGAGTRGPGAEETVSVFDLAQTSLRQAEFAYLSSCGTRGEPTPSTAARPLVEVLAGVGYTHVIGTLWSIDPSIATRLGEEAYGVLGADAAFDAEASAYAVHHAARTMRAEHPDVPARWAAQVHVGP